MFQFGSMRKFIFLISLLIPFISIIIFVIINLPEDRLGKYHANLNKRLSDSEEHFDFIIVGAGSAGSVLANRLTKNQNVTVLLLEPGYSDTDIRMKIPAAYPQNLGAKHDWAYYSTKQKNKANLTIFLPRGKTIGGSSSINGMIYLRGSAYDYDEWQKMGFSGWSYDELLPYFKKSENQQRDKNLIDSKYHGFDGEWKISDAQQHPINKIFIDAFHDQLSLPYTEDFNAQKFQEEGFGFNQVNVAEGQRHSVSDAFLSNEILQRKNLFIRTGMLTTKILFEKNIAKGVEYESVSDPTIKFKVYAKREVILSAGAYNTPQLLQLSGIGDRKLLEKNGIQVILNNSEVGRNLQDHIIFGISFKTKDHVETLNPLGRFPYNIYQIFKWMYTKSNQLITNIGELNGFARSPFAKRNNETAPDFQVLAAPVVYLDHGRKVLAENGISLGLTLLSPKSRGTVKIESNNPRQPPKIDPNFFGEKEDFDKFYEMLQELLKVKEYPKIKEFLDGPILIDWDNSSKQEKIDYILERSFLSYHPTSTAAMGKVVDERLRVTSIEKLRIVDASIMPIITRSNTNAPTVAIAEKASDMILEDNNLVN